MMGKALIKKTNEVHNIVSTKKIVNFTLILNVEFESTYVKNSEKKIKDEPIYVLSDDNQYKESELIIGDDNIRDWKIKNIIE